MYALVLQMKTNQQHLYTYDKFERVLKKVLVTHLKFFICLDRLEENNDMPQCHSPDQHSNLWSYEYKTRLLTTQP